MCWCGLTQVAFAQSATPAEATERTRRGYDLRLRWHLDEAEKAFEEALRSDNKDVSALLGMAEISRIKMDYTQSLKFLDRASQTVKLSKPAELGKTSPINEQEVLDLSILNSYGVLYLTLEEPKSALVYFDRILQEAPHDVRAQLGKAQVALLERDYAKSEAILLKMLNKKTTDPSIYSALSKVYLEQNRNVQATQMAQKALELDPYNVEAMSVLCSVRVIERKPEAVRKLASDVLELNPYNARIRRLLSQYVRSKKAYPTVPLPAQQAFEKAVDNFRHHEWDVALRNYQVAVKASPQFMQALLGLGATALIVGDLNTATQSAEQAIQIDPENALAQLQLSLAHIERHEKARLEAGASDLRVTFEEPTSNFTNIGDVFVNYYTLTPEQQKVIDASVAPFAHLLPDLKHRGAKHYLLQLDRQLPEVPGYEMLEDRTTFDGRFYSSIRGVGGLITVSGMEYLNVVEHGGFNTIAHEFAHQVHSSVFEKPLIDRIQMLYNKAVREGRALDYYAAANEWEYFAQGYEAYVSQYKRPGLGVTGRHTREELHKLDPSLYALIEEIASSNTIAKRNKISDK